MVGGSSAMQQKLPSKVVEFILKDSKGKAFADARRSKALFTENLARLMRVGQVLLWVKNKQIVGVLSWAWAKPEQMERLSKCSFWLPEDITSGTALYFHSAKVSDGARLKDGLTVLRSFGFEDRYTHLLWNRSVKNKHIIKEKKNG
jgi:hypothetical protein